MGAWGAIQRRQFSDDESAPSKKKKQRAPVAVKPRAVRLPSSLRDAVTALATQEFSSLPTSSQVLLLHALYEEAVSTETILEEAKKRKEALTQLQQELFSVGTQMREITALYSKQELALRDRFIDAVTQKELPPKQQQELLAFTYKPSDKAKNPAEKELAAFLSKKASVLEDLKARVRDIETRIIACVKTSWTPTVLGCDRHGTEYFWLPNDQPARVWVVNEDSGTCGYLWSAEQVLQLLNWVDNRGKEEQVLYSVLRRIGPQIVQTLEEQTAALTVLVKPSVAELSARKKKELASREFVLCEADGATTLRQVHGQWVGVPAVEASAADWWRCEKKRGRASATVRAIVETLFQPLFVREEKKAGIEEAGHRLLAAASGPLKLEAYKALVAELEAELVACVLPSYLFPDWAVARRLWADRVAASKTFSDVSYYLRDLEASCVNFAVINALTQTVDRGTFLGFYEKQMKKPPRLPEEGETVVYSAQGHRAAIQAFFRNNAFGSVFQSAEQAQAADALCKVQRVEYFWGNGNPFLRVFLTPLSPLVLTSFVESYYDCLDKGALAVTVHAPEEEEARKPFVVLVWLASTESEFVIPFSEYCNAFVNNLKPGDHIRMWFDGVDAQVGVTKKRKEARLEGSFLTGKVTAVAPAERGSFPWEGVTVTWDGNASEAGTNRINAWECEYQAKEARDRLREGTRGSGWRSGETRRLTENDLKALRESAAAIVKGHTAEEGEQFFRYISRYWAEKGQEVVKPVLSYETLDLGLFWKLMQAFGGYEMVVNSKGSWQSIYKLLPNYREQNTSAPTSLHKIYLKYLWQFEKDQREEKGLPPICQPRLPVATCPGKGTGKAKGEKEPGEKKGEELIMMDYAPNIQFMVNAMREQEKLKSVLLNKVKAMQSTLQYREGSISTVTGEVSDFAYRGIVHGNVCMLKRRIELITKFISQLKQILNFYL